MHEKRNFILVLALILAICWAGAVWLLMRPDQSLVFPQRIVSLIAVIGIAGWLFYAMTIEDKLPDNLRRVVGDFYYEADGLSFLPIVRLHQGHAELCLYYQNRFENPVDAIVHLRPPPPGESFVIQPGMRDVHFAFRADGGDFGVIHQPIAVPRHLQGQVIDVQMAASSWYPRSKGMRLRRRPGMPCGTMHVDWVGNALKVGVHEVSGEIPLNNPVTMHFALPVNSNTEVTQKHLWRQEQLTPGAAAMA
jgi:hypothetical protein